ncbi:MAG: hypothetical protein ABI702_23505 [Burkholderiales bacterium]
MQFLFGAGNMHVTQLTDAYGAAIANPTSYPLAVLQEGSIEESADLKELYGQNQRAVAIARGKVKTSIKIKNARVLANVFNAIYYGQTLSAGLISSLTETTGALIPTTPFQITIAPPSSGTYAADLGVLDQNAAPMRRVASGPVTGQYSVNVATGVYTFASADVGLRVYINFQYTVSAVGFKQTVLNLPMGYAPTFRTRLTVVFQGKSMHLDARNCTCTKLSFPFKNEDFAVPELEFALQDDGVGQCYDWSTSE